MRTINIQVSDVEHNTFGLSKDKWSFSEFTSLVEKHLERQALAKSIRLAEQSELSELSMEEISAEVKAVRQCKK